MAGTTSLRADYLATQDAVLALLNEYGIPDMLRLSLADSRWHYRPYPDNGYGVCSSQGSYRLYFRYGDLYALKDMARIADVLESNGVRFDIVGVRDGDERRLVIIVPETDMVHAVRGAAVKGRLQ